MINKILQLVNNKKGYSFWTALIPIAIVILWLCFFNMGEVITFLRGLGLYK